MKKPITLFVTACLLVNVTAKAQTSITLLPGTVMSVSNGTPLYIDGLLLTPSANYTIGAPNSLANNTAILHTITGSYIKRVYKWANTLAPFTGSIAINYQDGELNGIAENDLTLQVHNGLAWTSFVTGTTRDGVNNLVTTTGITNLALNELTMAGQFALLPAVWGPVKAYRKNSLVFIEWTVYHESSTRYYEVQQSTTGNSWRQVAQQIPALNTGAAASYRVADSSINATTTYYRIKRVDKDNQAAWSEIMAVHAGNNRFTITLFPNPAGNTLQVMADAGSTVIQSVSIYSISGKRLLSRAGNTAGSINIRSLLPGTYWLQVSTQDGQTNAYPFIKQ